MIYQKFWTIIAALLLVGACNSAQQKSNPPGKGIQIHTANPFYWTLDGEPTLLLGGSKDDNLFQVDSLRDHLELLKSVGGNYIRCTMSSRDAGNAKPYLKTSDGLYDLDKPNPEYWNKLDQLLSISRELDIVVQIEIWATYDFYSGDHGWAQNPFNPAINRSYTAEESGLPDTINYPAQSKINPFFTSVPNLNDNKLLLRFQQQFVNQLLSITLDYNHVLYSIDNETNAHYSWGQYWAGYLHKTARENGKQIVVTEMWDYWDPSGGEVEDALAQSPELGGWFAEHTNPDLHQHANLSYSLNDSVSYQFIDVSNHNAQKGETHYETGLWVRNALQQSGNIRPINNVKIYGGDLDQIWAGTHRDGQERFWRDIFSGHASARFHRPPAGIGLNKEAQKNIKSMRMLTSRVNLFQMKPDNDVIGMRKANEAFCLAGEREYLIYFPSNGEIKLNIKTGQYHVQWLNISDATWAKTDTMTFPGTIRTPADNYWGMVLKQL